MRMFAAIFALILVAGSADIGTAAQPPRTGPAPSERSELQSAADRLTAASARLKAAATTPPSSRNSIEALDAAALAKPTR